MTVQQAGVQRHLAHKSWASAATPQNTNLGRQNVYYGENQCVAQV